LPFFYANLLGMSARPKVVAVDLDGTILHEGYPAMGKPIDGVKEQLEALRALGWKIVVWTVRNDNKGVTEHLKKHGIPFDHINENPYNPQPESRKIFADVYVDNRAMTFSGDVKGLAKKIVEFKSWDK
jgi:hypothetical protein